MLAEGQHGVVARRQLIELGLTDARIKVRIDRGRLHVVHRGVYAVGHRLLSQRGRWMAAVLFGGPEAVLSHRSAAELWGIAPRRGRAIDVTRKRGWRASAGIVVHRSAIPVDEIEAVEGIPCTCVPRTSLDLAGSASRDELERAVNQIEVRRLTHSLSIYDLLERYPRRRGAPLLRALLDDCAQAHGITRSRLEERFAALLASSDLPRPQLNAGLAMRGRFFEVDCLWRKQRVIVELDGMQAHGTDLAFEKDRERDRLLIAEGWRVARITWRQLRDDAPSVLADLRRVLRS
jgi:very-short-patch-repair endonuclease